MKKNIFYRIRLKNSLFILLAIQVVLIPVLLGMATFVFLYFRNGGYPYSEQDLKKKIKLVSIVAIVLSSVVIFGISWFVSKFAVKPLQKVLNEQKQFIADASHELKTPIAVISANVSVLEQELEGSKWIEYIKKENNRMGLLVQDMLYLAREDAGGVEYEMTEFDLADAVAYSVLPFESLAYESGKKFFLDIPESRINIVGDEKKIKQVAIILVDNALKNSDSGAEIRVGVSCEGQKTSIKVYNTGHGIPLDEQKKIFNRFYRSDSSRARKTGGCGLGLSIAQTIVSGHGGKIEVESEVEKYVQFTVSLPKSVQKKKKKST